MLRSKSSESDEEVEMLMSLSLCRPPFQGACDSELGAPVFLAAAGAGSGRGSPGTPAASGTCPALPPGPVTAVALALPSASEQIACFFSRGGGIGAGLCCSKSKPLSFLWLTVSGMLACFIVLESCGLVRMLLIEGGGGRGGGERGLAVPFASGALGLCLFRLPLTSWLCTFKKRGLMKHSAPLVWLHSSSEGVLVRIECTPFIRQSWRESLQAPSKGTGLRGGEGSGGLLLAEELQKSENHHCVSVRTHNSMQMAFRTCSSTSTISSIKKYRQAFINSRGKKNPTSEWTSWSTTRHNCVLHSWGCSYSFINTMTNA